MKKLMSSEINELYAKAERKSDAFLLGLLISGNIQTFYSCLNSGYQLSEFILFAMAQTGYENQTIQVIKKAKNYSESLKGCFSSLAYSGQFDLLLEIALKVKGGSKETINNRYNILAILLDLFVKYNCVNELKTLEINDYLMRLPEGLDALIEQGKWYTITHRLPEDYLSVGYETLEQAVDDLIAKGYGEMMCRDSASYEIDQLLLQRGFEREFAKLKKWRLLAENGFSDLVDWDDYVAETEKNVHINYCFRHNYQRVLKQCKNFKRKQRIRGLKEKLVGYLKKAGR